MQFFFFIYKVTRKYKTNSLHKKNVRFHHRTIKYNILIINGKYGSNVQTESLLCVQDKTLSDKSEIIFENDLFVPYCTPFLLGASIDIYIHHSVSKEINFGKTFPLHC